jgi:hypothetical protein
MNREYKINKKSFYRNIRMVDECMGQRVQGVKGSRVEGLSETVFPLNP